ncbi:MAG: ABC transporter ATP-binding protein [Gammaproteobacteria bacterium]|nr:ABC transporter ATP-binding protein [Gammaproteobacteria bacterium]MBU2279652.1 ABC transporter ATP-binding protein [Gammaproteobacteria bacterium]MBU2425370.1 ABC transporter ATP-binding protein [Gammaproteobacteria bacterium]
MLQIQHLTKTYADGTAALRGLNLSAGRGIFGLLGPNGAGKSTLLRTIATLQQPDSGSIRFADVDVLKDPQQLRRQLGYLPQEFGVYPCMSCRALLEHMAVLKGLTDKPSRQQQIEALLAQTNLTAVADKAVAHFSGGMRQRFGIAQALLGDPKLLILDEPSAGLDPEERQQLHNLLAEISRDRLVLLSSHIVDDIEQLCRQVAIMLRGQIVLQGDTTALVAPLQDQIWVYQGELASLPPQTQLLQRSYLRGVPQQRFYAPYCPGEGFSAETASLQDRYFLTLAATPTQLDEPELALPQEQNR